MFPRCTVTEEQPQKGGSLHFLYSFECGMKTFDPLHPLYSKLEVRVVFLITVLIMGSAASSTTSGAGPA